MKLFRTTYRVSSEHDDWVAPEETLVDAGSTVGDVERPVGDGVFRGALTAGAIMIAGLAIALGHLAIGQHAVLRELADRNRTITVSVPPPRGIILDRNGASLVQNEPSFDLLVLTRQIRRLQDGSFPDLGHLARVLSKNPEELALVLSDGVSKNAVFFLATDITRDQVLSLKDAMPPGFYVITSTKRSYTDGLKFAHVLGYVGKVNKQDMASDPHYIASDTVGRLGVESAYEKVLRGEHGTLIFDEGSTIAQPSTAGANIVLTVDAAVQRALFDAMWGMLRESGLSKATAIAQDPRDGSILGLVSFPTYDNNLFSSQLTQKDFEKLFLSSSRPLFNRAIAGLYNPGSTIKPFIGMTALQEGLIQPRQMITNDCVELSVPNPRDPEHPYVFRNWRSDFGSFDLNRAIAQSCNIYFFTVGGGHGAFSGLGAERIDSYLARGLANTLLGIDLPGEQKGFVPTPEWKETTRGEPWYQGDTYNISIGQGDLLVTPLWINTYISAIANGGTLWQPRVVSRVVDGRRATIVPLGAQALGALPFDQSVLTAMRTAMRATVTTGTAKTLAEVGVPIAAKTGTAEVGRGSQTNSLLTLYAPANNPQIALTLLFEGSAATQGIALRAAKDFLSWYFRVLPTSTPMLQ